MTNDSDDKPPPDEDRPPPVLPYQAPRDHWKPPEDEVYGTVGWFSLILAGVAASGTFVMLLPDAPYGSEISPGFVCCFTAIPWLLSMALAVRVSLKSAGRVPAILALLVDAAVLFGFVYIAR